MESTLMTKIVGLIRIALGAAMIYFGATKIGASEQMIQFIGGAGHAM